MDKLMLSKAEAGRILGLSPSTIDRMISGGRIAIRRFGRRVLISRSEIEKLANPSMTEDRIPDSGPERRPLAASKV
jgi:excisionase family DNA binding protein